MKRLKASYTVENAVIIPLFSLIVLALIALGIYAGNSVMVKTMAWRAEVEMGMMSLSRREEEDLSEIEKELNDSVRNLGSFYGSFDATLKKAADGNIEVGSRFNQKLKVPLLFYGEKIAVNESTASFDPAKELKKWHAYISILKE